MLPVTGSIFSIFISNSREGCLVSAEMLLSIFNSLFITPSQVDLVNICSVVILQTWSSGLHLLGEEEELKQ